MKNNQIINVLLADDHMVVRRGLRLVLDEAADLHVVGEAESGEEALYLCKKLSPDIILMDVKMHGMGGAKATQMIAQHHPDTKVIALSTFAAQDVVASMFDAGAHGYLLKDISADNLTEAVRRVAKGERLQPDAFSDIPAEEDAETQATLPTDEIAPLGEQQKRVLALMTKGLTNPEIASQIGVSISTIRYHVSAILRKLDVSNRSEAVALAIRLKLVKEEDC